MTYRDRIPLVKRKQEAKEIILAKNSKAKELLRDDKFQAYKRDMDQKLTGLLKTIIEYKNTDPLAYAFYIQAKIKEYDTLAILLNKVEIDAGVSNETN